MKKLSIFIFMILSTLVISNITINADMGPKPTAEISIKGVNKPYVLEILIPFDGDVAILDETEIASFFEWIQETYYTEYPIEALNGYQDSDGFVARSIYRYLPSSLYQVDTHQYHIGYFSAPETFKIALIFDDDIIITSNIINRKMFNATFTFDLSGVDLESSKINVGSVVESIPYLHFSFTFITRVILTILVELGVLYLFRYMKRTSYNIVFITNLATQSLLTLFMIIGFYFWGNFFGLIGVFILGEVLVFVSEQLVYRRFLDEKGKKTAFIYTMAANATTLILGILTLGFI